MSKEFVVLADEAGNPSGTADKALIHTADTPLHFAFSTWLIDDAGHTLLTRRALSKITWPGVWTNSFCGHPAPGETNEEAVHRRASHELGITLSHLEIVLPDFQYEALDSSGIREKEICPVFIARTLDAPSPNPDEVDSYHWVAIKDLFTAVDAIPEVFSPWLVEELRDPRLRQALKPSRT